MQPERSVTYIERVKKFILLIHKEDDLETIKKELEKLNKKKYLEDLINYIDFYDDNEAIIIYSDSDNYRENYTSSGMEINIAQRKL